MCPTDSTALHAYDGYTEAKLFMVNFTSLNKCGTVEFRQHGASTKAESIIEWIEIISRFFQAAICSETQPKELLASGRFEEYFEEISK